VAAADVRQDLVEQIPWSDSGRLEVPQVVVRVADRQVGVERFLDRQPEPIMVLGWCRHGKRAPFFASHRSPR
jgi:hypothetical protein